MLCTKCSAPVRPVVAVDIDGTLGQYHRHFTAFAEAYLNDSLPYDYAGQCEFSDYLGLEKHVYREIKLAYRQGGAKRSMPVYPGALGFMSWLRARPIEIWVTTTRPYLRMDGMDPDTRFWLDRHEMHYDHLLYHSDKYKVLGESVDRDRVLAIIDDLPEQLYAAGQIYKPGQVFMPMRLHNSGYDTHGIPFRDFMEMQENIAKLEEEWHSQQI